jgi:flagellar protein FlgJ
MFDKQLSLGLSSRGIGLAAMIEQNIDQQLGVVTKPNKPDAAKNQLPKTETNFYPIQPSSNVHPTLNNKVATIPDQATIATLAPEIKKENKTAFGSAQEFVQSLWSSAKHAAGLIGGSPAVLLAQAALETDWGRKIIQHGSGDSSHNLFNIKSDPNWQKATTTASTLEHKEGVLVKEKANFRSYDSFKESFMDYVSLIKNNPRYQKALENAHEPAAYSKALQEAGYATDNQYASKIMGIMKSPQFQALVADMK